MQSINQYHPLKVTAVCRVKNYYIQREVFDHNGKNRHAGPTSQGVSPARLQRVDVFLCLPQGDCGWSQPAQPSEARQEVCKVPFGRFVAIPGFLSCT